MKGPQNEWIPATVAEITEKQKDVSRFGPQGEILFTHRELSKRAGREKKAPAREKRISTGPARFSFGPQGEPIPETRDEKKSGK